MLATALHAVRWHPPHLCVPLDLVPSRAEHFAGASCGEDREFQRSCGHPPASAQFGHEFRNLRIGQRGVMLDLRHLPAFGQHFLEMAPPLRRIRTLPIAAHGAPTEHALDPAARAVRRFGPSEPVRSTARNTAAVSMSATDMLPRTG